MAKVRIPKKVAGVKIPKKVRKRVKVTVRFAESPAMRELASTALARAARRTGNGGDAPRVAALGVDAEKLGEVIRTAALDGLRRFLDGFEEGLRQAAEPAPPEPEPVRPARPKRRKPTARPGAADASA